MNALNKVKNYKSLGAHIESSIKDINNRISTTWSSMNKMYIIWKSNLTKEIKLRFFRAAVESILIYGSECWTLTKKMTAKLDGVYTRLLRAATNTSWETHITNQQLYGKIPKLSTTICRRRLRFSGHCF